MEIITKNKLIESATEFGESLANCMEWLTFKEAQEDLNKNKTAKELLSKYQLSLRVNSLSKSWKRNLSKDKSNKLRNLEDKINSNPIIKNFLDCQNNLQKLLVNINKEISDLIGIDFASNSKTCGCR